MLRKSRQSRARARETAPVTDRPAGVWRTYAEPFFCLPLSWRQTGPGQAAGHHAVAEAVTLEPRRAKDTR